MTENRAIGGTTFADYQAIHPTPEALDTQFTVFRYGWNKPPRLHRSWAPWFSEQVTMRRMIARIRRHSDALTIVPIHADPA